jgi:hypothetical protein
MTTDTMPLAAPDLLDALLQALDGREHGELPALARQWRERAEQAEAMLGRLERAAPELVQEVRASQVRASVWRGPLHPREPGRWQAV